MILAAAHAGAYRVVEPHNGALTPRQLRNATRGHRARPPPQRGLGRAEDDSQLARLHRGRPADITPRSWDSPYTTPRADDRDGPA